VNPRAKPQADWGGTIQKFATGTLAVSALVGGLVMAIVGPKIEAERTARRRMEQQFRQQFMLGIRDRLDILDAIQAPAGPSRTYKVETIRQKLEQEARMLEKEE
jgi:hypothetical protein